MRAWLAEAPGRGLPLPILSFPGVQRINASVRELVADAALQARCMAAIAERYPMPAAVSLMDLSVEAEAFGAPVRFNDDEVPTVTAPVVHDADDAARLARPAVGAARTGVYLDAVARAKKVIVDRPVLAGAIGPFSLAGRLMDMNEIMIQCLTEPEAVTAVLEKVTAFLADYYRAFRDAGADGILMAEPAAGLLSPELNGRFSTPYVRRLIEAVETDEFLVIYHNCGNTIPLLPGIVATGAKALHFGNAVSLAAVLAGVPGDRVVMGNVDPAGVLRQGTAEDVRAATRAALEAGAGHPNFLLSSGCDIPPLTPLANLDAFFAEAEEFHLRAGGG